MSRPWPEGTWGADGGVPRCTLMTFGDPALCERVHLAAPALGELLVVGLPGTAPSTFDAVWAVRPDFVLLCDPLDDAAAAELVAQLDEHEHAPTTVVASLLSVGDGAWLSPERADRTAVAPLARLAASLARPRRFTRARPREHAREDARRLTRHDEP